MNLVGWVRSEVPPAIRRNDFALMPLYLRALGETGARDELLLEFANMLTTANPVQQPAWSYHSSLTIVLAFCGRLGERAAHARIRKLPHDLREFWLGTSELAAGEIPAGRPRLERLQTATNDELLRSEIAQRLTGGSAFADAPLSPPGLALLYRIEQIERPPASA